MMRVALLVTVALSLTACGQAARIDAPPQLSPVAESTELVAMQNPGLPLNLQTGLPAESASLWSSGRGSLLGTGRAETRGDIVTVVIEIDDKAEFSNSTNRSRSAGESLGISDFFGIPQRIDRRLPEGASLGNAVGVNSNSDYSGDGKTSRKERLTLRVAATVTEVLPNGSFAIEGRQELRLNYEIRELLVTGIVRPEDISRRNEVPYDRIAAARISYGGRGQIDRAQQPRFGQRVVDAVLPF